jgi:CTP synthase
VRQLKLELGPGNAVSVHVTLVPYISAADELKTKPTQHSVKELREIGIQPDILLCRTDRPLDRTVKEKISLFANVPVEGVVAAQDVSCLYELPGLFHAEGLDELLCERLNIWSRQPDLAPWQRLVERFKRPTRGTAVIAVVGKYVHLRDSYKSLHEALVHGAMANDCRVDLRYIDAEAVEKTDAAGVAELLADCHGILVPGGFGERGTEGKITAIRYARERGLPFFGICLGMQLAVAEFARHVAGIDRANSAEFDPRAPAVIDLMPEQRAVRDKGATMRLGAYPCALEKGSLAHEAYGTLEISERHRHRYEVNNDYRDALVAKGLVLSGTSPDRRLVEVVELPNHPYFLGCQFHPELKSRPMTGHPLFVRFVKAALDHALGRLVPRGREERPTPTTPVHAVH